jgi:myo-inositol 2-dehydrogenase/D-chiro-inositol 1-dehydrogenase
MSANSHARNSESNRINRRQFIAGTGAAAVSLTIVKPEHVRGSQANSKIALGLIGCGGRGTWIADLFRKHGGFQIAAGADYFQDRVDNFGNKFQLDPPRRYTGLSGFRRLLDGKVDAVAIESPPFFHPAHAAAAVDAGAHVYLAKPIAVDVPGCRTVERSAKKSTEKRLCFLVDFQTRTDPFYREAVKRAQAGDIGSIISGEAFYVCGITWGSQIDFLRLDPRNPERRLRAWGLDRALSGDVITEQNIHVLDVATWILDSAPIRAVGTGGQKGRDVGNCWDYFSVIFTFPRQVVVTFHSKQYGKGLDDLCCRMYGTEGIVDTHYFGDVYIRGNTPYPGGKAENLYTNGVIRNIAAFFDSIQQGEFSNPTVAPSVRSNLTTILGRSATYKRSELTWEEVVESGEELDPKLDGLKE